MLRGVLRCPLFFFFFKQKKKKSFVTQWKQNKPHNPCTLLLFYSWREGGGSSGFIPIPALVILSVLLITQMLKWCQASLSKAALTSPFFPVSSG